MPRRWRRLRCLADDDDNDDDRWWCPFDATRDGNLLMLAMVPEERLLVSLDC
jgi:hypothetical protein